MARFKAYRGAPVGVRCREIRYLVRQLVVAVRSSATAVMRWSNWRRWHQAWARDYHYLLAEGRDLGQDLGGLESPCSVD